MTVAKRLLGMKQRIVATFAVVVCIVFLAHPHQALAKPSVESVLSEIRSLSQSDFVELVAWARSDNDTSAVRSMLVNGQIAFSATPTPSPTPQVWRDIPFTTMSLGDNSTEGNIQMIDGSVKAQVDGRSIIACVSFKNISPKTALEASMQPITWSK